MVKVYPRTFLDGLRKATKKPVTLVGVMAMIQTEYILNTIWKRDSLSQLVGYLSTIYVWSTSHDFAGKLLPLSNYQL
jgi:hypothetical protein